MCVCVWGGVIFMFIACLTIYNKQVLIIGVIRKSQNLLNAKYKEDLNNQVVGHNFSQYAINRWF